ncbi:P-loop containing nucleoside triphosphate hydrolase protein [Mycena rebaudengoi]|nr:P-loop containing nucleoside triphosphate hydrolase protein [Mycena rebaudengoi]
MEGPLKLAIGAAKITAEQLAAIEDELKLLPDLIKTHYTKWTDGAKPFQLQCMRAQKLKKDVLLHAFTGAGKTGIAAGPNLLPSSKGKVTLVVSPLLSLHDKQACFCVTTFRDEFRLKATAINSTNGGCTKEIMEQVVSGEWQIVMLSPEMLLSRRFVDGVLRKPAFGSRCLSVFIDEAHCVSHWGDSFRKKYASIGIMRAFLPRATPIIAVTATLTPRVHQDLLVKLQYNVKDYLFCSIGNDCDNVAQVIRSMEHAANSYRDLDFLVDEEMKTPADVHKAFLYTDDIKDGGKITDHLNARVKPEFRHYGLVRPYNAGMSRQYRAEVMALFKAGIVRILVCTDAAGTGCDIPDVELVVQWKAPKTLSSWIQRAGRAARKGGTEGLAVMIVEKSAFEVNLLDDKSPAEAPLDPLDVPPDAPAEGLYALIQATTCRRIVLMKIFKNSAPNVPAHRCCDICNPKLFDQVRPSKPVKATRQKGIRKGSPVDSHHSHPLHYLPPPPPTAGHKRPHDSQGTLRDTAAPTARRPRIDPGPQTPRPAPRPLYRGSPFLPSPATTSSQKSTSLHPPTTPRTPATYSAPPQYYPYYPPSYPPYQMYGGASYYLPPAHSLPNATQTPASLRNNPYAAYFTPPTISSPTPNPASSTDKSVPAPNIELPPD